MMCTTGALSRTCGPPGPARRRRRNTPTTGTTSGPTTPAETRWRCATPDRMGWRVSSSGTVGFYLGDRQGSVKGLLDGSGVLRNTITYDAVGAIATESAAG